MDWRGDHTFFILFVSACLVLHRFSYRMVFILSAFVLFWICYDFMRLYPNYLVNEVHVGDLYDIELSIFGVYDDGTKKILSEWFVTRTMPLLTIIAGISYLLWVPGPIFYTLYLSVKERHNMMLFSYGFLITNFVGFIIYYLYPAAPPWYYIHYGNATDFTIPGSEALLAEFDQLIHYPLFNGIYGKNANVFAAVPSLHAAYPVLGILFAIRNRQRFWIIFFSILTAGIWFAAVYSQHHYIVDLLLGMVCAVAGYFLIIWLSKRKWFQKVENWILVQLDKK